MADGGVEFENPEFDRDDIDGDEVDNDFMDDTEFHRIMTNQYESLNNLTGETRETEQNNLMKMTADEVDWILRKDKLKRPIFGIKWGEKDYPLSYYKSNKPDAILQFTSFDTIQRKYGVNFIRDALGVSDYQPSTARLRAGRQDRQALITANNQVNTATEQIPLQDFSTQTAVQETADAVNSVETILQTLMDLPDVKNAQTQTEGLNLRELQGLDKALQSIRGELVNNLAKLTDIDKDIAKEKRKLGEAEDKISKRDIKARLKNLEDEKAARLEAASANKEALRGQINRIKETINKVLKEDTTIGERLKTLFGEQGITTVSVLTAIGMIIGVIVEAVIPTSGGAVTPPKPPSSQGGVKEWVKKQLRIIAAVPTTMLPTISAVFFCFHGAD